MGMTPGSRPALPFRAGWFAPLALFGAALACDSVPYETAAPPAGRLFAPSGVIRGTVQYSGPHPCSSRGHIVGAAIVFLFDRRSLPAPNGTASTPVNFGVVTGEVLFAQEPRNRGSDVYCPLQHGITDTVDVAAAFEIGPVDPASYIVVAFYDYTGNFQPGFKFRALPEQGDIGGGHLDAVDALKNTGNPNYQPHFLPVDVGIPQPLPPGQSGIPHFKIPSNGFVADNVTVTIGSVLPMTRPYFYPQGLSVTFDASSGTLSTSSPPEQSAAGPAPAPADPNYEPVLKIPQDWEVLAPPDQNHVTEASLNNYQASFPHLRLNFGLPSKELPNATDPSKPFRLQIPQNGGGFSVWQNATLDATARQWVPQQILEGDGIPQLWPIVAFTKLVDDDPKHQTDPGSLTSQGSATAPVVVIQGITLLGSGPGSSDSLKDTVAAVTATPPLFDGATGLPRVVQQDHLTVMIRPSAICFDSLFDPNALDKRGVVTTPYQLGLSADLPNGTPDTPVIPPASLTSPQILALAKGNPLVGCLPTGRYAINVVYPDGQAWTVPNEAGACTGSEGATDYKHLSCVARPRPVLYSQGTRAVVEVVPAMDPTHCQGQRVVPTVCLPR
jgi:hypothetical protein